MSAIRATGERAELPRAAPASPLITTLRQFAGRDARRWRFVAALVLREAHGLQLGEIGQAIGRSPGQVSRGLRRVVERLREEPRPEPAAARDEPGHADGDGI